MGLGPSARLEGHFSPVTPLPPPHLSGRTSSSDSASQTSPRADPAAPPPSPESHLSDVDSDGAESDGSGSGMSLSETETDPELCIIGRAMALRANPTSISPP